MRIFNFSQTTGELLSEGVADESPMSPGEWLLPVNSTTIVPPVAGDRQCAVFSPDSGEWRLAADYRGVALYDIATSMPARIGVVGMLPADYNLTEQAPPESSFPHKWDGAAWVVDAVACANEARMQRDARLAACDWTVLADAPLSSTDKTAWKAYRQALRDVPAQPGFPTQIDWPVAP
jgi:hypothetical protein